MLFRETIPIQRESHTEQNALHVKNAELLNANRLRGRHTVAAAIWTSVTIAGEVSVVTGSESYMSCK